MMHSVCFASDGNDPVPPDIKSDAGYLKAVADAEIAPVEKRVFVQPRTELHIAQETPDALYAVLPGKNFSAMCIIPKYARHMAVANIDRDSMVISFRAGLELQTVPTVIPEGIEMAVRERLPDGFVAMVKINHAHHPFFIPEHTTGLLFDQEDDFAKFARKQEAAGLVFSDGKWITADEKLRRQRQEKAESDKANMTFEAMKKGAEAGFIVLHDGRILNGTMKGNDLRNILFESGNEMLWLGTEDVQPLDTITILARGNLDTAKRLIESSTLAPSEDSAKSRKKLVAAVLALGKITPDTKDEFAEAKKNMEKANHLISQIDNDLKKDNKVIYKDIVFPEYIVKYHLSKGHILLRGKFWVSPEQCCPECQTKGFHICATCGGEGQLRNECQTCHGTGRIPCQICHGKAWKECPVCGGKGFTYKKGRPQTFAYFGSSCYYPRYWNPGRIVATGRGAIAIIGPSPVFRPPYCSGTYIGSGGSGDEAVKTLCWNCGGTGTAHCPKTQTCPDCRGAGVTIKTCPTCNGRGNVRCANCNGRGFTGKPKTHPKPVNTEKIIP
ncbi:MAG: hypothetical protein JW808_09565 [Victivallales bacterium]|nr:hypothetical protein [Victivallales bacterium]